MRPWYRYSPRTDNIPQARVITPFSKIWGYGAPVTLYLVAINVAIWLIMVITNDLKIFPVMYDMNGLEMYLAGKTDSFQEGWYSIFAMIPALVFKGRIWQIVTSIFIHDANNILHLVFNMYLLWMFGPRIERTFTSRMFLAFYIVTGIGGSILSLLMRSLMGETLIPSLGASAAVFGILVCYAFLFGNELILLFFMIPVKVWKAVVGFIALETLFILFELMQNVDHWGHLGGAATSAIWMVILFKTKGHKTAHGWFSGAIPMGEFAPKHEQRSSGKGFRIIFRKHEPESGEHPEGSDDEPPPDWFKI